VCGFLCGFEQLRQGVTKAPPSPTMPALVGKSGFREKTENLAEGGKTADLLGKP
jgi:hypothetical protein